MDLLRTYPTHPLLDRQSAPLVTPLRRLLLADVPYNAEDLVQRVGRAVRFMGHAALPPAERRVEVKLYVATHPHERSAEQLLVERLQGDLRGYAPELAKLKAQVASDSD